MSSIPQNIDHPSYTSNAMWMIVPLLMLALVLSIVYWSFRNGISPMPSTRKQRHAIVSLLPPGIHGEITELGSGWGTLAVALARNFPACRITGYENSPVPFFISTLILKFSRLQNLNFQKKNFLDVSLKDCLAVVCYFHPAAMKKLQTKLESESPAGVPVICNTFAMSGWKPERVITLDDIYRTRIYLYRVPWKQTTEALRHEDS